MRRTVGMKFLLFTICAVSVNVDESVHKYVQALALAEQAPRDPAEVYAAVEAGEPGKSSLRFA